MLSVEQTLTERLPWLAQHPLIRRPMAGMLGRLADEDGFNRTLVAAGETEGFDFVERVLDVLGVSYFVNPRERENIPVEGGVLIVANHPLGMIDALTLLQMVGSVRSDVRILANDWLMSIEPLRKLLLPVDVFGKGAASKMRDIYRALDNGEALIVFPAGEVSRVRPSGVSDGRWADGFARLAQRSGVPVLPIHVAARNSAMFYGLSMLAKPLSTAMLPARSDFAVEPSRGFQRGPAGVGRGTRAAQRRFAQARGEADASPRVSRRSSSRPDLWRAGAAGASGADRTRGGRAAIAGRKTRRSQ